MSHRLSLPTSLVLVLALSACASLPKHPVSRTAEVGTRILAGVETVQDLVIAAETAKVIPTNRAADVMILAYKAGDFGERLAVTLSAYDAATSIDDKTRIAANVATLVRALDEALNGIIKIPLGEKAEEIGKLVANVLRVIEELRAAIPALRPSA